MLAKIAADTNIMESTRSLRAEVGNGGSQRMNGGGGSARRGVGRGTSGRGMLAATHPAGNDTRFASSLQPARPTSRRAGRRPGSARGDKTRSNNMAPASSVTVGPLRGGKLPPRHDGTMGGRGGISRLMAAGSSTVASVPAPRSENDAMLLVSGLGVVSSRR